MLEIWNNNILCLQKLKFPSWNRQSWQKVRDIFLDIIVKGQDLTHDKIIPDVRRVSFHASIYFTKSTTTFLFVKKKIKKIKKVFYCKNLSPHMVSTSLPSETLIFSTTHSFSSLYLSLLSLTLSLSILFPESLTRFSTDSHRVRFLLESSLVPTMSSASSAAVSGEFMLFGVRVVVDSMRKSVSMNNLSQYEQPHDNNKNSIKDDNNKEVLAAGYASADDAVPNNSGRNRDRERKRGSIIRLTIFSYNFI